MNYHPIFDAFNQQRSYPIALRSNSVMNYAVKAYKPLLPHVFTTSIYASIYSFITCQMQEGSNPDTANFYVTVLKDQNDEAIFEIRKGKKTFGDPCHKQVSEVFRKIAEMDFSGADDVKFRKEFENVQIVFKRYYEECRDSGFFIEIANQDRKEPLYLEGSGFPDYFVERRIDTLQSNRCNRLMFYYFKELGQELYGCSPDHVEDTRYRVKDILNRMKDHCEGNVHEVRILDKSALL